MNKLFGNSCFITAEIGTAHEGDEKRACELIDAAYEAGADAVKVQIVFAAEILHPRTGLVELPGGRIDLYRRFQKVERDFNFYKVLRDYAHSKGIIFFATPFGLNSLDICRKLKLPFIKLASPELNHLPLLEAASATRIPVILSTGVSLLTDIERAVSLSGPRTVLLHCVTAYPAPETEYNLRLIQTLSAIFGLPVGVSDHSFDPLLVPCVAAVLGACLIEKHLCLGRRGGGLDDAVALSPSDFARMVSEVRRLGGNEKECLKALSEVFGSSKIKAVIGDGVKRLAPAERANYGSTNRSLHAQFDLKADAVLTEKNLALLRTEKNLSPGLGPEFLKVILGKTLTRAVKAGQGISWTDLLG